MEGAAQTILSNVGQLMGEEFRLLRSVGGEVAELRDELATMNALLRMQAEAEDGAVDHFVREWMKQLRELSYDAEDCVDLYIFRVKCARSVGFYIWCKRQFERLWPRRRLAGDIRALRARAVAISERHARYGVSRDALRCSPSLARAPAMAASAHALRPANDPEQFVGIREQANELAMRVKALGEEESDMKLKVFSIVGFGGLGKTTLAMEVCRQLETDFDRQAQVSVSQAFDAGKDLPLLLKRLIQQVAKAKSQDNGINEEVNDSVGNIEGMDVEQLIRKLKQVLDDKRYLIVVDDVWTISAWDAIKSVLPTTSCGSRIIVTSRIESVAKECSDPIVGIYQIKALIIEDARKLFISRAFGSLEASCPSDLASTMDKILMKCGGLPLAIVSIASLLSGYRSPESIDMWDKICRSIGSQMQSHPTLEGMRHIITLSYDHLPYHLKACMLYLCIFPEDYVIRTSRLLYRWIAEGLVEEKRGLTLMEVAESYFDELMSRSMIIPTSSFSYNGRVEACQVHDMMLEVMVSKSLEANFVSLVGGPYEGMLYDRIRRLSIHGTEQGGGKGNCITRMDMQHVRSLSMFELEGQDLLNRLGEFTLLRVLDLEGCKGLEKKHMEHVCRMHLLRFLSLRDTDICSLPHRIGDLEHLQVLDARNTCLDELPETVTELENLEHLNFYNKNEWYVIWKPLRGMRKMKALREVSGVIVKNIQVAKDIGELRQLQEICIWVDSSDSSENQKVLQEVKLSICKIYSLRSFSIGRFDQGPEALNFLLELPSAPRLLRYLRLDGGIERLPDWVRSLDYLVEILLLWTRLREDKLYGVLCKLPNLVKMDLRRWAYVDRELVACTAHNFPKLKTLIFHTDDEQVETLEFQKGSMDKLEELEVTFHNYETKSIIGCQHLVNLKEVKLTGRRSNPEVGHALEQLKTESMRRPENKQFKVGVRYE